jgi:hypothetical protein
MAVTVAAFASMTLLASGLAWPRRDAAGGGHPAALHVTYGA